MLLPNPYSSPCKTGLLIPILQMASWSWGRGSSRSRRAEQKVQRKDRTCRAHSKPHTPQQGGETAAPFPRPSCLLGRGPGTRSTGIQLPATSPAAGPGPVHWPVFLRGANEGSQSLPGLGTQRDLPGPLIIAGSHASPRAPERNLHSRTFCSFCFLLKNRSRKYTHFSPPAGVGFEEAKAPQGGGRGMRRARPVLGAQALEKGGALSQPSQAWP